MARSPAQHVRSALDAFWSGEALAALHRARDASDDGVPPSRSHGHWLVSEAASDALAEAAETGELTSKRAEALRAQVRAVQHALAVLPATAALRTALARARLASDEALDLPAAIARIARADDDQRRAGSAREIEHTLRPIALDYVAAHARAETPLLAAAGAVAGSAAAPAAARPSGLLIVSAFSPEALALDRPRDLPAVSWSEIATGFLAQTDAAADDAVRYCLRKLKLAKVNDWHALLRGLRAPELDSTSGARQRWLRASAWLRGLGFERELNARMRAETLQDGVLPFATTLALDVPRDLRVAQIAIDYGVISDVFASEAVARALGLALTAPALPSEHRWPIGATTAGAFGALALQLWGEREHLERVHHLTSAAAERAGRLAGTIALLWARACTAVALVDAAAAPGAQRRSEALAVALGRALCCEVPPGVAGLLGGNRVLARERALEALSALALHVALRERGDADWYRNPRSAEHLRSLAARGNALPPEAACQELGVGLDAAARRGIELVT